MPLFRKFFFIASLVFIASCSKEKEEPQKPNPAPPKIITSPPKDTIKKATEEEHGIYIPYKLTGAQSLADLSNDLGEVKMTILFKINRRDLKHLKEGETIIVPNNGDSELIYSPFPQHLVAADSFWELLIGFSR